MANLATDARKSFHLALAKLETSIRFAWGEMWTDLIKLTCPWTFASQNTIIISMVLKFRNCSLQMLMVMRKHLFVEQLYWFWNQRPNNWNYWSVLFLRRHPVVDCTEQISLKCFWIATIIVYSCVLIVILCRDCLILITKHPSQFQWPFWIRHCPYALNSMISWSVLGYTSRKFKMIYMHFFGESVYLCKVHVHV